MGHDSVSVGIWGSLAAFTRADTVYHSDNVLSTARLVAVLSRPAGLAVTLGTLLTR